MVIKWLDASNAEEFGQSLAQLFIKRIPASVEKGKNRNVAKELEAIDQMYIKIEQFKLHNKLNIYKKAMLAKAFKYELIAAGYNASLVDRITKGLIIKL